MPLRNPFRKSVNGLDVSEESRRTGPDSGFQETTVSASNGGEVSKTVEYKLSEINDSGVFLPPSPTERKSFWKTSSSTSVSSNHRSMLSESEPFNISRESFESYRRSFDISARSPVPQCAPRHSLDSRRRMPRSSLSEQRGSSEKQQPTVEEDFEEVGLADDPKPKKRGLFARFGEGTEGNNEHKPAANHSHFNFTGRKRGLSGQGSELRNIPRPDSAHASNTPAVFVDS